jgi:hypothetical protein
MKNLRAFLRLELNRLITWVSWYEVKLRIVREAIRSFIANFLFRFLYLRTSERIKINAESWGLRIGIRYAGVFKCVRIIK